MRKWFWYAVAAAFVGVGGVGYYAYQQPRSLVGQLVFQAGEFGLQVNPVTRLTRQVLAAASQKDVVCCEVMEGCLPEEPTPVEESGQAGQVLAGAVDLSGALHIPGIGVTIEDTQEGAPPGPSYEVVMPNADNDKGVQPAKYVPEVPATAEEPSHCPRVMPYTPEQEVSQSMPYCPGSGADPYDPVAVNKPESYKPTTETTQPTAESWWSTPSVPSGTSEEAEPASGKPSTPETPPASESNNEPAKDATPDTSSMQDYHHSCDRYHSGYIVCPYSGKCVQASPPCDSEKECKSSKAEYQPNNQGTKAEEYEPIAAPNEEPEVKEPVKTRTSKTKKSRKRSIRFQSRYTPNLPVAPYTDTMEYRRSDGSLNEVGPGPF